MNIISSAITYLHQRNIKKELKRHIPLLKKESEGKTAKELVDLIYSEKWNRFFWIKQIKSEILHLCRIIEMKKPRTILEIGTASGGSLFLFSHLADKNASIYSIDLPGGTFGGGYPDFKIDFYNSFASENQSINLIRADSHSNETYKHLVELLNGQEIDFLFIDGDHSYEGVKKDFDQYSNLISPSGIIAFHDIAKHPEDWNVHVDDFWNEIKMKYKYNEFIENKDQGWAGIGVLQYE